MDRIRFQDVMATETQGAITDRPNERLGTADRGVVLLREMLLREMQKVEQGLDPLGVARNEDDALIDTFIDAYIDQVRQGLYRRPLRQPGGERLFAGRELAPA
jgi:hypothetical protein